MSLQTVKRVASRLFKAGESRVRILDAKRASEALTADDVRTLIKEGVVTRTPSGAPGRGKARLRNKRRQEGRGRGPGSRRGTPSASFDKKKQWMRRVRALRKLLNKVKPQLKAGAYSRLYSMVKGGSVRDKKQLLEFLKTKSLLEASPK